MEIYAKNIDGVWFGIASQAHSVLATTFGSDKNDVVQSLKETLSLSGSLKPSDPSALEEKAFSVMKSIRDGKGTPENVSLCMDRLPAYTQRVLRTVTQIPVGYVASYGGVAKAAGGGARAVGNAMAKNPFAPIVPCHRVVTSSLGLGGYTGGLRVKYELLKREKRGYTEPKNVQLETGVLKVFPVEFVLGKLEKLFEKRPL